MPTLVTPPRAGSGDHGFDSSAITAARLVAIAITALLVSFLVISRTGDALSAGAATPPSELSGGTVSLTDDDGDRTLFDLTGLLPAHPVTNCITVAYEGTAFDGTVELRARGGGELAPLVDVSIEAGSGGGFDDCDGFEPAGSIFDGTIRDLVDDHGIDGTALPAMRVASIREVRTFRVTMSVHDDAAASGRTASIELVWSVRT